MPYAWLTDIHLEFLKDSEAIRFVKGLAVRGLDGLFLTGDISTASKLEFHLRLFEDLFKGPVYQVQNRLSADYADYANLSGYAGHEKPHLTADKRRHHPADF